MAEIWFGEGAEAFGDDAGEGAEAASGDETVGDGEVFGDATGESEGEGAAADTDPTTARTTMASTTSLRAIFSFLLYMCYLVL